MAGKLEISPMKPEPLRKFAISIDGNVVGEIEEIPEPINSGTYWRALIRGGHNAACCHSDTQAEAILLTIQQGIRDAATSEAAFRAMLTATAIEPECHADTMADEHDEAFEGSRR